MLLSTLFLAIVLLLFNYFPAKAQNINKNHPNSLYFVPTEQNTEAKNELAKAIDAQLSAFNMRNLTYLIIKD